MNRVPLAGLLLLTATGASGCISVGSHQPTLQNVNGDSWFVANKGLLMLTLESKIYYCPAPTTGPAECKEAKTVPLPDAK